MSKSDMPHAAGKSKTHSDAAADVSNIDFGPNKFWIAMCLDVLDHHVVGAHIKPPSPEDKSRHAMQPVVVWLWMLRQATHKDQRRLIAGREVFVKRGQFAAAQSYIAQFANWTRKATRVFLERLVKHGMIEVTSSAPGSTLDRTCSKWGQGVSVITICNYGKYQRAKIAKGQPRANEGPMKGQRGAIITTVDTDTEDREREDQSPLPNTTIVESITRAREEKFEAAPDVIDLDLQRVELTPRGRMLIEETGIPVDAILQAARDAARSSGQKIRSPDVYCLSAALRRVDPTLTLADANRLAKKKLNGDLPPQAAYAPPKKSTLTEAQIKRMSASPAQRSNLANTNLLKRR